jgi:hypothetical protein
MAIPGLTVSPEVGFSATAAGVLIFDDVTRGKLDTGQFGDTGVFVDLISWFRGGTITRGVSRHDGIYGKAEAGRATMVLANEDRRFDPTNLAGPYVAAGVTQVEPEREFRYRAVYAGVGYNLFRGFADDWDLSYAPPNVSNAILRGTDGTKVVSNYDQNAGGVVGTGEDTGARINRVLDNIDWAASDRDIDVGLTTVQGTDLSANAWAEVVLNADTEIGEVYFDGTGKLVFRNRHAFLIEGRSTTPQAVFGDEPGELGYTGLGFSSSGAQIRNLIRISRVGGTQQTATDPASVAKYRTRTWGRSDLIMQTDAAALDYAQYVLSLLKDPELRFDTITVNPRSDPANLFPQVLGRELGDRITIKFTPPGGGGRIERDVFIRGITHDIGLDTWKTTWVLQDAEVRFSYLIFDHATLGKLDSNAFAY